jgi:hypothetical protein
MIARARATPPLGAARLLRPRTRRVWTARAAGCRPLGLVCGGACPQQICPFARRGASPRAAACHPIARGGAHAAQLHDARRCTPRAAPFDADFGSTFDWAAGPRPPHSSVFQ